MVHRYAAQLRTMYTSVVWVSSLIYVPVPIEYMFNTIPIQTLHLHADRGTLSFPPRWRAQRDPKGVGSEFYFLFFTGPIQHLPDRQSELQPSTGHAQ
jgi:hypothetical protein